MSDAAHYEILDLPTAIDERGSLTYIEQHEDIPFEIKRAYYIYDVPPDEVRGEHAHTDLEQVIVAVSGSLDFVVDDGDHTERLTLSDPTSGLYVPPMTWRRMENFEPGTVCLVFASAYYDPDDYIHDYESFRRQRNSGS